MENHSTQSPSSSEKTFRNLFFLTYGGAVLVGAALIIFSYYNKESQPSRSRGYIDREYWADKNVKGYVERTDVPYSYNRYGNCRTYTNP